MDRDSVVSGIIIFVITTFFFLMMLNNISGHITNTNTSINLKSITDNGDTTYVMTVKQVIHKFGFMMDREYLNSIQFEIEEEFYNHLLGNIPEELNAK